MKPQYVFLILFALFITGLADGLEAGFAGFGASIGAVPVIGTIAAAVTAPVGIALGLSVSWCINITLGAALLVLLAYHGMAGPSYWRYLFPGSIAETVPGLDALPFWALVVILCVVQKTGEEQEDVVGLVARTASSAVSVASNPATARGASKTLEAIRNMPAARPPSEPSAPGASARPELRTPRVGVDVLPRVSAEEQHRISLAPAGENHQYVPQPI